MLDRTKQWAGFEDTSIVLMDRVKNLAGTYVTQASLSTMTYRVDEYASEADARSCSNGSPIVGTPTSLTIADCVFDTLQTSAPWDSTADPTGYNIKITMPKTTRPNGGKWHRYEIILTPTSGADDAFPLVWIIETLAIAGS